MTCHENYTMKKNILMTSCMPGIPSVDRKKSLRCWVEGLGFKVDREMRHEGSLIGCMVHNESMFFWLNQRTGTSITPDDCEGIRLYWAPSDIHETWEHFRQLGYNVSDIVDRDYGQTEFFITDEDGYSHCFGLPTKDVTNR